jgi:two-component system, LytTR family, response regulator
MPTLIPLTCILADDERPSLEELKDALKPFENLTIIGTANNSTMAIELINTLQPDIAFLDIEMPPEPIINLLDKISCNPSIIFCTAYNHFAVKAFEQNAMDYLLKPVQAERLSITLQRVISKHTKNKEEAELDAEIIFTTNNQYKVTSWRNIYLIESEANYTKFYFNNTYGLRLVALKSVEDLLPANKFLKINRGQILNKAFIARYEKHNRKVKVTLINEQFYYMSKGYSIEFLGNNKL